MRWIIILLFLTGCAVPEENLKIYEQCNNSCKPYLGKMLKQFENGKEYFKCYCDLMIKIPSDL